MVRPISPSKLKELQEETQNYDSALQSFKNEACYHRLLATTQVHLSPSDQLSGPMGTIKKSWLSMTILIIFKRNKVLIPPVLRKEMLKIAHQPHLGVWPEINKEIAQLVKSCSICNRNKPQQTSKILKPHPTPSRLDFSRFLLRLVYSEIDLLSKMFYYVSTEIYSSIWLRVIIVPN